MFEKKRLWLRQSVGLGICLACFVVAAVIAKRIDKRIVAAEREVIEYSDAIDSLKQKMRVVERPSYGSDKDWRGNEEGKAELRLEMFDPNTIDSASFRGLGFTERQTIAFLNYRKTGARFRQKEDFKKLFFVDDSKYERLEPYIHIAEDRLSAERDLTQGNDSTAKKQYHAKRDTILELNSCDTSDMQLIRGIGRYTAIKIADYRRQLGGFAAVGQLYEIENISADSILAAFWVDTTLIKKIQVNSASVETLQRHPYISFTQAQEIYDLRRRKTHIQAIEDLLSLPHFTQEEVLKLSPYLDFEAKR